MPASIKTVLTADDKQLKKSLEEIKKYMKETYSDMGKATQEASKQTERLDDSKKKLAKTSAELAIQQEKYRKIRKSNGVAAGRKESKEMSSVSFSILTSQVQDL